MSSRAEGKWPVIAYVAAAGDIVGSYRHWRAGSDVGDTGSFSYSGGIFAVVERHGGSMLCLSPYGKVESLVDGRFTLENIPHRRGARGALAFYRAWLSYSWGLVRRLMRERPDLVIISDRVIFYPMLALLKLRGARIVHSLHMALWNPVTQLSRGQKMLRAVELFSMRRLASAVFGLHGNVVEQMRQEVEPAGVRVREFLAEWPLDSFSSIPMRDFDAEPFRIFFVGRMEANKGVTDLLDAFSQLIKSGSRQFALDYFGDGNAVAQLRDEVARRGLGQWVTVHGKQPGKVVRDHMAQAHVVAVPTRSDFIEGLNKVVVEGVLAGRAVVTSAVCGASELVPGTVVFAQMDDPSSYAQALLTLATDRAAYERAAGAGPTVRQWLEANKRPLWKQLDDYLTDEFGAPGA